MQSGTTTYLWDGNGNRQSAANTVNTAGNKSFTYNLLNLPLVVTNPLGTITYTYDATGDKLRKVSVQSGTTKTTDYISGIEYDNSTTVISFIQTEEGKAAPNDATAFDYNYYLGDNLGNTRVTFGTKTGAAVLYQQDDYYPFGLEINRTPYIPKNEYLYNKKELQEEFTEYDYGARFYDPVIGRMTTIDPLAEKSRRFSTYTYVSDNPISRIDPDGMTDYTVNKKTGDVKQVGEANKDPDRVLQTDKKGNVKKKGEGFLGFLVGKSERGQSKVAFDGIEKGILKGGENLRGTQGNIIDVNGKGQPTTTGVETFMSKLADYVGVEVAGYELSNKGESDISHIFMGGYQYNDAKTSSVELDKLNLLRPGNDYTPQIRIHTHLTDFTDPVNRYKTDGGDAEEAKRERNDMPNIQFRVLLLPNTESFPYQP